MGPTGPAPATQISQPHLADPIGTAYTENLIPDLTTQKPPPRTIPYQPPPFNLDRPTKHLTKEERLEVHHNYISAVSNLEHKKDLINRLKRSKPHNILTYETEMICHMALHHDVLGRIHTILKHDDYFRTLEELPAIDGLHACDDIQLFPEHSDLSCLLHHHLQQRKPNHMRHHRARNPHQAVQYHVNREHPLLLHCSHKHNQMIAPSARLLRPQCLTLQKKRYQNHSMERESRIAENKLQHPQLLPKTVVSASDVNSWVT